jgi:uncharacterized protein YciI
MEFIYIIRPYKENFIETMTDEESNIMSEHAGYIGKLLKEKTLVLAGPTLNGKFGIVVFYAENEDEAKLIMLNDPAVKKNIVTAELNPFKISFLQK